MQPGKLTGKTCLLTGGGSGIGRAVAKSFVAEGCKIAIAGRTESKLKDVWAETGQSDRLIYRTCDVSEFDQVKSLVDWATQQLGQIDILINNAGINIKQRSFRELTPESFSELIRPNLDGAFYCMYAVLPQMLARHDGLIINISSTAGKRAGTLGGAGYSASKFAMSALSLSLGVEEKDSGVRSTVIYPGEVDTPILEQRPQPVTEEHRRRILRAEDVAEAVLFVASLPPRANVPELIIKPTTQPFA